MYSLRSGLIFFLVFSFSCQEQKTDIKETDSDTTALIEKTVLHDETLTNKSDLGIIISKFTEGGAPPLIIDTAFIHKSQTKDTLTAKQLKLLTAKMLDHSLTSMSNWELEKFYQIDSIKVAGKYNEYCSSLDLGMMKYSNVYPMRQIKLDEKTTVLIWELQYGSYEACPHSEGMVVYATIIYLGKPTHSLLLAEYMTAADPPVSTQRTVIATILEGGKIEINVVEINDEGVDIEKVEEVKENYMFQVLEGIPHLLNEKKMQPRMVKRKS